MSAVRRLRSAAYLRRHVLFVVSELNVYENAFISRSNIINGEQTLNIVPKYSHYLVRAVLTEIRGSHDGLILEIGRRGGPKCESIGPKCAIV